MILTLTESYLTDLFTQFNARRDSTVKIHKATDDNDFAELPASQAQINYMCFIKDVVKHFSEEHNSGGISTHILNMNPIFYGISDDDETQQMEYFTPNEVIIDVYNDDDTYSYFTEKYEHLDDTILDNVFLCFLCTHYNINHLYALMI